MRNRPEGRANCERGKGAVSAAVCGRARGPYLGVEVGEGSTHPIEAQSLAELGDLHNGPGEIEE